MAKAADTNAPQALEVPFKITMESKNNFGGTDYVLAYMPTTPGQNPVMHNCSVPASVPDAVRKDGETLYVGIDYVMGAYPVKGMYGWKKIYIPDPTRPLPAK